MNFKQDIQEYLNGEFNYFQIPYSPSGDISNDLLKLFTIHRKLIIPYKRTVKTSQELKARLDVNGKYSDEILLLQTNLENGIDINPHQSRQLFNFHVHDDLIYDWKIYHLHLSLLKTEDDYFLKRTKEVLFVYITREEAYFLQIFKHPPHDVFADKILLEIIDNNWSDILIEAKDVIGLSHNLNTGDRFTLRKYNVNEALVQVNGKFIFSPGLGQTSSGHSAEEVMKLNRVNRWLKSIEKEFDLKKEAIDKMFIEKYNLKKAPKYKLIFTEKGPQIWDINSKICVLEYEQIFKF